PSVIDACLKAAVPVVMSIEDFKLTCPAGQHLRHGKVCTKCLGFTGKELWCAVHGCRQNRVWSTAYAIRNIVNNMRGIFHRIDLMLPCSQFNADILRQDGYADEQIHVVPNFSPLAEEPAGDITAGKYAAYVGRISPEKGLPVLIDAAKRSGLPVKIAGDASEMPELVASAPGNVEFVGKLSREGVADFFRKARLAVVSSVWYECFGIVAAEAQGYGVPVLASRIGGLQETITDGETGLLFEAGNAEQLAGQMSSLWNDEDRLRRMSIAARARAQKHFTRDVFYRRLMAGYERATQRCARRRGRARAISSKVPTPQAV
ncbi:MAG: glycosyltransferase family 4 protein, partial [Planctomycetota bacterium]